MKSIAFDLDGVLVCLIKSFKLALHDIHSLDFDIKKQTVFNLQQNLPLTKTEINSVLHIAYAMWKHTPIYNGAEELCNTVYACTQRPVKIVTNRPYAAATKTYALINRFCKVPYELILNYRGYNKGEFLHDYEYFVEDRRRTAIELAKLGKTVFLVNQPWNQGFTLQSIKRIPNVATLIPWIQYNTITWTEYNTFY